MWRCTFWKWHFPFNMAKVTKSLLSYIFPCCWWMRNIFWDFSGKGCGHCMYLHNRVGSYYVLFPGGSSRTFATLLRPWCHSNHLLTLPMVFITASHCSLPSLFLFLFLLLSTWVSSCILTLHSSPVSSKGAIHRLWTGMRQANASQSSSHTPFTLLWNMHCSSSPKSSSSHSYCRSGRIWTNTVSQHRNFPSA